MKVQFLVFLSALIFLVGVIIFPVIQASPSYYFDDEDSLPENEYLDNDLERILYLPVKRDGAENNKNCIGRGGNCDSRPSGCCDDASCRCNLWGANCKCHRRGIFQKWGK